MEDPKALNILQITENNVKLDTKAFNFVLDKVGNLPIVIYSISGSTRSGKSFLLNYFIKYFEYQKQQREQLDQNQNQNWLDFPLKSSFKWRSGRERETTGMNLWSEPYFVKTDNGPVAVLLMDTQGLFDDKTTARQNAIIFSLTSLYSSVTIFNVSRQVNEDLLQQIQYFSSYAHMVSKDNDAPFVVVDESSTNPRPTNFPPGKQKDGPFQNLLLLVRDFEIPGYAHGLHGKMKEPLGSRKNFMRDTFHLEHRPVNCPEENTLVRQGILQEYDDVSAYLLPDPGKTFIREEGNPDEEFLGDLKLFIENLASSDHLVMKRIDGRPCSGTEFKRSVNRWAKLIDKSEETFPRVMTMSENLSFMNYTMAKEMALTWYRHKMDNFLFNSGSGSRVLRLAEQASYRRDAFCMFHRMKKFPSSNLDAEFEKQLEDGINEYLRNSAHRSLENENEEADAVPSNNNNNSILNYFLRYIKRVSVKHILVGSFVIIVVGLGVITLTLDNSSFDPEQRNSSII